ncbi:MAG: hypothetical protein JO368_06325, partial [Acidimicrobiales bacterium]|nr:hypothetical protein [Acidimicrobiales bacterium]
AMEASARALLERRLRDGSLTARGYRRVHRVARTIADLAGEERINECAVAESLMLRGGRSWLGVEEEP